MRDKSVKYLNWQNPHSFLDLSVLLNALAESFRHPSEAPLQLPVAPGDALEPDFLSALCAGAAGALATHALAREDAQEVALLGATETGKWHLRCLAELRVVDHVTVFDSSPFKVGRFAAGLARDLSARIVPVDTLAEALYDADIVVAGVDTPLVAEMLNDGVHVSIVGAEGLAFGTGLLEHARIVCDDRSAFSAVEEVDVAAELGEILRSAKPARTSSDELTVYTGVGSSWQDFVVAQEVYRQMLESRGF